MTTGRWLQFVFTGQPPHPTPGEKPEEGVNAEVGNGSRLPWQQGAHAREPRRIQPFVCFFTVFHSASRRCFCCRRSEVITRPCAVTLGQNNSFNPQQRLGNGQALPSAHPTRRGSCLRSALGPVGVKQQAFGRREAVPEQSGSFLISQSLR